jgi:hypothetical protein
VYIWVVFTTPCSTFRLRWLSQAYLTKAFVMGPEVSSACCVYLGDFCFALL